MHFHRINTRIYQTEGVSLWFPSAVCLRWYWLPYQGNQRRFSDPVEMNRKAQLKVPVHYYQEENQEIF